MDNAKTEQRSWASFPNEVAFTRLVGVILLELNDEWKVQRCRYMKLETMLALGGDPAVILPEMAAATLPTSPRGYGDHAVSYTTLFDT